MENAKRREVCEEEIFNELYTYALLVYIKADVS